MSYHKPLTCAHMSIQGGPDFYISGQRVASTKIHAPVHETMTLAALVNSDYRLSPSLTLDTLRDRPSEHSDVKAFVRGVLWNDDPACELFTENAVNDLEYSTALNWARIFMESKTGLLPLARPNLIGRSHFADLQWLHGMGSTLGEDPRETKRKMLLWLQVMYSVAIGSERYAEQTRIRDTPLRDVFDDPPSYETLGELFTRKRKEKAHVRHRALGTCFHVIQDSYAVGHTRRERLEHGGLGAILDFHTYKGQDSGEHDHFDHSDGEGMPVDLRDLDGWTRMVGCREGVDRCITLANFWLRQAGWEEEVFPWLDGDVFRLSGGVRSSDVSI